MNSPISASAHQPHLASRAVQEYSCSQAMGCAERAFCVSHLRIACQSSEPENNLTQAGGVKSEASFSQRRFRVRLEKRSTVSMTTRPQVIITNAQTMAAAGPTNGLTMTRAKTGV